MLVSCKVDVEAEDDEENDDRHNAVQFPWERDTLRGNVGHLEGKESVQVGAVGKGIAFRVHHHCSEQVNEVSLLLKSKRVRIGPIEDKEGSVVEFFNGEEGFIWLVPILGGMKSKWSLRPLRMLNS